MPEYGLKACQGLALVNISSMVQFDKNWELENGQNIRVLTLEKVTKTGNIGKKSPVADCIDYLLTILFL